MASQDAFLLPTSPPGPESSLHQLLNPDGRNAVMMTRKARMCPPASGLYLF